MKEIRTTKILQRDIEATGRVYWRKYMVDAASYEWVAKKEAEIKEAESILDKATDIRTINHYRNNKIRAERQLQDYDDKLSGRYRSIYTLPTYKINRRYE